MLAIRTVRLGVKIAEVYFSDLPEFKDVGVDLVRYVGCKTEGEGLSRLRTLLIDLTRDEDTLMQECSKNNRYKINRAGKSDNLGIDFVISPSSEQVDSFCVFYEVFAGSTPRGIGM